MAATLLLIGLLYFLAHAVSLTFTRTHLPDVLVLMVVGIVVGPVAGLVNPATFGAIGPVLATITLAAILFESGTSLDIGSVARSARSTLALTLATLGVTIGIVAVAAVTVGGMTWGAALLLGAIVCGTSSAVVIPMVQTLRMGKEAGTILVLESALTDVLCIVLTVAALDAHGQDTMRVGPVVGRTLASLTIATAIGVAGATGWLRIWNWVRQFPATIFSTLAWALVLYGIAELLGFSGAIAVLAFGLGLRNHEAMRLDLVFRGSAFSGITDVERRFYSEVVFLLKTFFFVYLGVSMRFDDPGGMAVASLSLAGIYAARLVIARLVLQPTHRARDAGIVAIMVPKGLAAAVLAGLPVQAGIAGGAAIQTTVHAVVFLSIAITAIAAGLVSTTRAQPALRRIFPRFTP